MENDPTLGDSSTLSTLGGEPAPKYQVGELLGRGGMGEVVLARDAKIGRDVALKRMRAATTDAEAIARFEREAKIQARLDHPAIVPVHDFGHDEHGRPYFTMKRLAGTEMSSLIRQESQQRLLRALVDVCLAIELAHTRRIVHRDLKPANIMLGDYGEVYVLDWGVARYLGDPDERREEPSIPSLDRETEAGTLLGTPGFMAPEQVAGADDVGPAADVYALGAILFEILARASLHPRGVAALSTTLADNHELSPAKRHPELAIPPELDAACVAALAKLPSARPTARELGDRIQRYLDGDRDLERRRDLASTELAAARTALAEGKRADAVHLAGRAVALDPSSRTAVELLTSLIVEPPTTLPGELAADLAANEEHARRQRSRRALPPFLAVFAVSPIVWYAIDVASWLTMASFYVVILAMTVIAFVNWRIRAVPVWVFMIVQALLCLAVTRFAGPLILTPAVIVGMLLAVTSIAWVNDRTWAIVAFTIIVTTTPYVLEAIGWFRSTWMTTPDGVLSHGAVFKAGGVIDEAVVIANLALLLLVALYALQIARDHRSAQRKLSIQAWHLRQLLPRQA